MNKKKSKLLLILIGIMLLITACSSGNRPEYEYEILEDGTIELGRYLGNDEIVEIPSEIEGRKVTSLCFCFSRNENVKEVKIPDTVTEMYAVFRKAKNLEKVTGAENVVKIKEDTFRECMKLTEIPIFSNLKVIEDWAFKSCDSLEMVVLPEGLKTIGNWSFIWCDKLKEINIPKTVNEIGVGAFGGTAWEKELEAPAIINDGILIKCETDKEEIWIPRETKQLADFLPHEEVVDKIYIPNTISEIPQFILENRHTITIYIPSSVTHIDEFTPGEGEEKNLCFVVEEGSYAEGYAKENGIRYEIVEDVQAIYDSTFEEHNAGKASINNEEQEEQ